MLHTTRGRMFPEMMATWSSTGKILNGSTGHREELQEILWGMFCKADMSVAYIGAGWCGVVRSDTAT